VRPTLFFTVEHGDNKVPDEFAHLFTGYDSVLASHRGYDPGAGELAVRFSTHFHAPCEQAKITRLLIDQNRSRNNRRALFSEFTRGLPKEEQKKIIDVCYWPYQYLVRKRIESLLSTADSVLHLAIHSFTPVLNGQVRNCDVGLMYDPSHKTERSFCRRWQEQITDIDPAVRVRRNYPYRGVNDGIVRSLRQEFSGQNYIGLQIEVNQKFPFAERQTWKHLQKVVIEAFSEVYAVL